MAYQVLARKWRPKRFQDVVGQKHITTSLQNAFKREKIGHAYMLTGTRGIGKTTVARLFAKSLRCENRLEDGNPCGECRACVDFESGTSMNVMEIDGASNNSVEDVRDLIGNVQYLPTYGKYKIYIIDEVHMLSSSAFNALLKTLEEPPEHVVFIMATTEPQKLLGTVLSRCQRFDFRNANLMDLVKHVENIAEQEGITFENSKLVEQICRQGRGSFRDTLSLVDQVLSFSEDKRIDEETVAIALGLARVSSIREIVEAILEGNDRDVSRLYRALLGENISVKNITLSLLDHLFEVIENADHPETLKKNDLIENTQVLEDKSAPELIWIFENLSKESSWAIETLVPEKATEILLQKLTRRREFFQVEKRNPSAQPASQEPQEEKKKSDLSTEAENRDSEPAPPEPEDVALSETPPLQEEMPAEDFSPNEELGAVGPQPQPEDLPRPPKTWESFLDYLRNESPALATYIEHGNLLNEDLVSPDGEKVFIDLGFKPKDDVMYNYVNESETRAKLTGFLAAFFQCSEKSVELKLETIKESEDFKSMVEIREEEENLSQEKKRERFLEHPMVKEAQKVFNTQVDKLILNKPKDE